LKILIVGAGGREHALAWKLAQEAEVHVAPGNPGIAQCATCHDVAASDQVGQIALARHLGVDFVLVGPEAPLIGGLADMVRAVGIPVFGPGKDGAEVEGSKAFAKTLMREAHVRTAEYRICTEPQSAFDFVRKLAAEGRRVAVKASGAALGKGVVVCASAEDAEDAIEMMMVKREFLEAGDTIVVEERLQGPEFSLLTLCSDDGFLSLPLAQDYKRALDGDKGLNTGGMGSYSPVPWIGEDMVRQTEERVVAPLLGTLKSRGIQFRGMLFSGMLIQDGTPYCLEYNVRFGDPETQSIVPRLGKGFAAALWACAQGKLIPHVEVLERAAVSVVLASGGYPSAYQKGIPIHDEGDLGEDVVAFHAGTKMADGRLVTDGGRVMAVTASAQSLEDARSRAYAAIEKISFSGMRYRSDIAQGVGR
jgi:phosphoribosylamine--glycine ligase